MKINNKLLSANRAYQAPMTGSSLWNRHFLLVVAMSSIVNFGNFFLGSSFSLWIVDMGGTNATYGTIHSLFSLVVLLARPLTGWIIDHGNRKRAFIVSSLVFAVTMVLMLVSPFFGLFVAMRLIQGAGNGCAGTICNSSAYDFMPPDKLEKGIGYFALSNSLVSALTGSLSVDIYNRSGPVPLAVWSVIAAAVGIVLSLFIVFRSPVEVKKFQIKEIFDVKLLFEKRALKPALISAFSVNLSFGLRGFIMLYGRSLGFANPGWFTTVNAIALVIVRLVQDALPRTENTPRRSVYFAYAMFVAYIVVIGFCGNLIMYLGAAVLWAIVFGVLNPQLQSFTIQSVPIERRGAASSTFFCSADIGVILGSSVGGYLADAFGYRTMFLSALIPIVLCIVYYAFFMDDKIRASLGRGGTIN